MLTPSAKTQQVRPCRTRPRQSRHGDWVVLTSLHLPDFFSVPSCAPTCKKISVVMLAERLELHLPTIAALPPPPPLLLHVFGFSFTKLCVDRPTAPLDARRAVPEGAALGAAGGVGVLPAAAPVPAVPRLAPPLQCSARRRSGSWRWDWPMCMRMHRPARSWPGSFHQNSVSSAASVRQQHHDWTVRHWTTGLGRLVV